MTKLRKHPVVLVSQSCRKSKHWARGNVIQKEILVGALRVFCHQIPRRTGLDIVQNSVPEDSEECEN